MPIRTTCSKREAWRGATSAPLVERACLIDTLSLLPRARAGLTLSGLTICLPSLTIVPPDWPPTFALLRMGGCSVLLASAERGTGPGKQPGPILSSLIYHSSA